MHSENWDDLRFVLTVAETGTVSGAARTLGVNHATVLRRVAAFESRYGAEIFERTAKGYVVRPDRLRMIEAARDVDSAVRSVARMLQGEQAPVIGSVRVSSTDTFCENVLPPVLAQLHKDVSGLHVALVSTNAYSDFSRSQADIAVRPTAQLAEDMVGDVAAELGFGIYAISADVTQWVGLSGPLLRSVVARWMANHVTQAQITGAADSFPVLARLALLGMGRAVLPCVVAAAHPDLVRLDGGELPQVPVWVASHVDMAGVSRIETTRRYLVEGMAAQSDVLRGAI